MVTLASCSPAASRCNYFAFFWLFGFGAYVAFAKQRAATSWFRYRSAALRRASLAMQRGWRVFLRAAKLFFAIDHTSVSIR